VKRSPPNWGVVLDNPPPPPPPPRNPPCYILFALYYFVLRGSGGMGGGWKGVDGYCVGGVDLVELSRGWGVVLYPPPPTHFRQSLCRFVPYDFRIGSSTSFDKSANNPP